MNSEVHFLPGCYRNFPCEANESLPGYLLRLAEANGYTGIVDLLRAAGITLLTGKHSAIPQIRTSLDSLSILGSMAIGKPTHLHEYWCKPLATEAIFMRGCRVDNDALMDEKSQVCPQCLAEHQFAQEDWDLALVTVCGQHNVRLLDICQNCEKEITWSRPALMKCQHCAADFRAANAIEVNPVMGDVSKDFAALAPFRFLAHNGEVHIAQWDTAFRVFKGLALTRKHWALAEWPARFLRAEPVEYRHKFTVMLAGVRNEGTYFLSQLSVFIHDLLAPLKAIPRSGLVERQAMRLLHSEAGIPSDVAEAICSPTPLRMHLKGAQVFNGQPPSLLGLADVARFLGVDTETVSGLVTLGIIDRKDSSSIGHDIDQVLAAQRFLANELLTFADLRIVIGVALDWDEPIRLSLLPRWNQKHASDVRVSVEHILKIQLQLIAQWDSAAELAEPTSLRDLSAGSEKPFTLIGRRVLACLGGAIRPYGWAYPFDWASLAIENGKADSD